MRVALAAALLFTAGACSSERSGSSLPYYTSSVLTPRWMTAEEVASASVHRIAPFRASDQSGRVVTEAALTGKATVAHFFFTSCGDVCPVTTKNIGRLLREIPDRRVQVLSYSVRPEADSGSALRRYAKLRGISDPRWRLLTAPAEATAQLARESYFVRLGKDSTYGVTSIAHTESLVLVDGNGRIRGVYAGTLPLEMSRLREDIDTLLRDGG